MFFTAFHFQIAAQIILKQKHHRKMSTAIHLAKRWEINLRSKKAEVSVSINFHLAEFISSHRIPQFLAMPVV